MRYVRRHSRSTHGATGLGRFWRLGKTLLLLAAIVCAGWLLFQRTVQSRLGHEVQKRINLVLADSRVDATIGDATFLDGTGLKLNNLSLSVPNGDSPVIEIYEALLRSPACMTGLCTGDLLVQSIEVRRASLNLVKDASGRWNFEPLLDALTKLGPNPQNQKPLIFRDCEIELTDHTFQPPRHLQVSNLTISVMPIDHNGRRLAQVKGHFAARDVRRFAFTTWIDLAAKTWKAELNADDLRLSRDAMLLLPGKLSQVARPLRQLSGRVSFQGSAAGQLTLDTLPSFQFVGDCADFTLKDRRLPKSIEETSYGFRLNENGFAVTSAVGKLGDGQFEVDYQQTGWLKRETWRAKGKVDRLKFKHNDRWAALLPSYCEKFCRDFRPVGMANLRFDMTHDGQQLHRNIHAQLTDMAFTFVGLPYTINHCVGVTDIVNRDCQFHVRATEGDQPIDLKGVANNLGQGATFQCNIVVPGGLPINEKMFDAIKRQPKLSEVLQAFNPTGFVGGTGLLERKIAGGPVHKTLDVRLQEVDIRHDRFPYPIREMGGLIHTRDDQYTFSQLIGSNARGQVICNGTWNPTAGLDARLECLNVPLDDQLRVALKPSLREIWNGFRPRGTVDHMLVDLRLPIGQEECDVTVEANLAKHDDQLAVSYTSIYPTWFPYEIRNLTGRLKIGDGKVLISQIEGQHDRTWIKCNGDGQYSNEAWSVRLKDMLVLSLAVDDDLLAAVPTSLAPQVRNLQYQGKVNAGGEMTLAGRYLQPPTVTSYSTAAAPTSAQTLNQSTFSLAWDVRLDMTDAQMMVGVPVENVFGAVHLVGQYDGQNAQCRGDLDIDSLMIYDNQITKVHGPIWLDNDRAGAGLFAKPGTDLTPNSNTSPVGSAKTPSLVGQLHGGTVHFDAQIASSKQGEFYLQSTLNDGKLEMTCQEMCPSMKDISGRTFAAFRLAGDCSGTHTYRGDGTVQLRDAAIYELPPVLSLLKKLKIGRSDRSAFDSSNINFTISGETFDLNRIELLGDTISLLGNGRLDMDRKIDLDFYSIIGRNRFNVPLLSELAHASSQQALWLHVDGTLDDPQMSRKVLPQLNDSLRQLFQPPVAGPQQALVPTRVARGTATNAAGQRSRQAVNGVQRGAYR